MNTLFGRLIGLAFGAWLIRAAGPDWHGVGALGTNLLAAVVVQAGLLLSVPALCVWVFTVGLFWDFATFSPLGHHGLVLGVAATLVRTQRGLVGWGLVGRTSRGRDFGWGGFFCVGPIIALLGISRMGLAFLP